MKKKKPNLFVFLLCFWVVWVPLGMLILFPLSIPYIIFDFLNMHIIFIILIYFLAFIIIYNLYIYKIKFYFYKFIYNPFFSVPELTIDSNYNDSTCSAISILLRVRPNQFVKTLRIASVDYTAPSLDWLNTLTYHRRYYNTKHITDILDSKELSNLTSGTHMVEAVWNHRCPIARLTLKYSYGNHNYEHIIIVDKYK